MVEAGIIAVKTELLKNIMNSRKWAKRLEKAPTVKDKAKIMKRFCQIRNIQYVELDCASPLVPHQGLVQCVNCGRVKDKETAVTTGLVKCPVDDLKKEAFALRRCTYHKPDLIERALV